MTTARKAPKLLPPAASPSDADAPRRFILDKLPTGWLITVSAGQGRYHDTRHAFASFDAAMAWLSRQPVPADISAS